ncbi:FAST kinase domain-containing protein 3, mitochondrial-like [Spodoptera frugiperda]|uniref:FAST kinase domain-containing protein 3, mitochondrial-like n=1 Tax=Spodoptera frugiperda TaxID=7108 RepID=A0A9R0EPE0_SPOFR|nr:FAST kinase domain-containing protein 3, mitochondrial-like [Spodoptera frugiperda]
MSLVLRRTYLKAKNNILSPGTGNISVSGQLQTFVARTFSEDKSGNNPQFSSSTILIENGFNVQELPVAIKKLRNLADIDDKPNEEQAASAQDTLSYQLIQEEFKQCLDLRDVFSLLSKCTKITPNIALGAIERIYDIEKNPNSLSLDPKIMQINLAKGAILDKLLKVVMKTEDTCTILEILNTVSSFMEPFKYKFHDELLLRVIDNKLSIDQLCEFINFLIKNKNDIKYSETIDKLWVGFVAKEKEIDENNIVQVFGILHGLKVSKRIILTLLEQKLCDLWFKIKVPVMQDILTSFVMEKYLSVQSFGVVGSWLCANIHALDEDSLLDIISKLTRLKYTDDKIEKAVEKYMRFRGDKVESHVLIVGLLNFCMQFQIYNKQILNSCCDYFLSNWHVVPPSFLKSFIYPFGYLQYDPVNNTEFWKLVDEIMNENFDKMTSCDLSSIILSSIYLGKYPSALVRRMLSPEYLAKVKNADMWKRFYLIDTAMTLECEKYLGPLLPKDQWSKPITQDFRVKNILEKIMDVLVNVAGGQDKLSVAVSIPYLPSDETYLLDVMLHSAGLGSKTFNWKSKTVRNANIAILIHLPDHYCSNNEHLIGPQVMKKRHLKILGMKVVSLKYSLLSQFYTTYNKNGLTEYLLESINNAEQCM